MLGYTQVLDCGRPTDLVRGGASSYHCGLVGQSFGSPPWGAWNGVTMHSYLAMWQHTHNSGTGQARWALAENWQRVGSVIRPHWLPQPRWSPNIDEDPLPHPAEDPMANPIGQPAPVPHAPPSPNPGPNTNPNSQPDLPTREEPYWPTKPVPSPNPYPPPAPSWPTTRPNAPVGEPAPGVNIPPTPNTRPTLNPKPRNSPKRPPKDEKQRKERLTPHGSSVVGRSINWLSETGDFIQAIWWALPKEYRSPPNYNDRTGQWHRVGAAQMAKDVYDHLEHVDMNQAMQNLIDEQAEDMLYGQLGKAVGKSNKKMGEFGGKWNGWALGPAL